MRIINANFHPGVSMLNLSYSEKKRPLPWGASCYKLAVLDIIYINKVEKEVLLVQSKNERSCS